MSVRTYTATILVLLASAWGIAAPGDVALPTSQSAAPAAASSAQSAAEIYTRMANYLGSQKTFFVELNSTSTITGAGEPRVNGGLSRVWYRRPDHIVWTTQSDIGASALAINGETSTLYLPALSRYMVTPVNGPPDAQMASMAAPYGIFAMSLFTSATTSSLQAVLTGEPQLLADEEMLGVPCHHLVLPTRSGNVELWTAQGMIPLPVKVTFGTSIPPAPGETSVIESRTEVSFRWRVNVDLPDSTFQLKLPETAVKTDKLGSPVVMAKLRASQPDKPTGRKSSSRDRSSSNRKPDNRSANDLGLPFEPPPDLNQPLPMRSAPSQVSDADLPSLSGTDAVVRAAIQGPKADAVPSGTSYQPEKGSSAPPPPSSAAESPGGQLTLMNGQRINLASYRGKKAVVLDFWATWCGPCRQSMPIVNQVAQAWRGHDVEFFAVNMGEQSAEITKFLQQTGVQIPVAVDPTGQMAAAFGVSGIPHLVVIGKDGTIKGTHTGADRSLQQNLVRDLTIATR